MMTIIKQLFETLSLGDIALPVVPVSGGFMHRMYKVCTVNHTYAVKHLNCEIMKRPSAMENYKNAEQLEAILEEADIPIVPALTFDGKKMQEFQGNYFYIFDWHDGSITDWNNITAEQCRKAGNIQGRIHAIETKHSEQSKLELSTIDWREYLTQATDYKSVFGLTYTWIEWLEYNIQRVLGSCQDKSEQELGLTEVKNTINRIKYIHQMEDKIKSNLNFED